MRIRQFVPLLLCLFFASYHIVQSSAANKPLRVNETTTRILQREGKTIVALAVENMTGRPLHARVELEWVDPSNIVDGQTSSSETIMPGAGKVLTIFPMPDEIHVQDKTLWYRLRYRVVPESPNNEAFAPLSGIISLSEITPDIFELSVTASEFPFAGKLYRVHVRALHPITSHPIGAVKVAANLKFDNGRKDAFNVSGVTNAQGYIALDFNLPRDLIAEDGTLEIKAKRGEFNQEAEIELRYEHLKMSRILLTTDKPIYQPGQPLHIRALALDFSRRAIANADLELKIEDPDGTMQFRTELKTSRFGVGNADWVIPDNTRLGDYRINIEMNDDKHGDARMSNTVKISRYDLPNFAVKTKPDREYYLPGQNAEVEIHADYLFGQPVTKGHVRIVREKERHWNYREQKWDTQEAEKYEGEIDPSGHFIARIDLTASHKDFNDESYSRYKDLAYAAYLTDATTGRTEQKRFDLRVTREAIHVYVIGLDYNQVAALPVQFYVSASYASGAPAECEIAISQKRNQPGGDDVVEEQLQKIKTNHFGVAKVTGWQFGKQFNQRSQASKEDKEEQLTLMLTARDGKGNVGHHDENIYIRDRLAMRVTTNKSLYAAGEPIEIQLTANRPNATAVLSVSQELQVLHSQVVRFRNGKAFVVLPYRREFKDEIGISVIANEDSDEDCCRDHVTASSGVMYPRDRELKLDVRMSAAEYRPGNEARASFRVFAPDGRPVESALGVSVIDRAVEERARTDRDSSGRGGYYDFTSQILRGGSSLAGVELRDLRKLDLTKPISDEMQLIAEILLRDGGYAPHVETSGDHSHDQKQVFARLIEQQFKPMQNTLNNYFQKTDQYPHNRDELDRILNIAEIDFNKLRDPWDTAYQTNFSTERERDLITITSAGADKKFDTADDFVAFTTGWPYFNSYREKFYKTMGRLSFLGAVTLDVAAFKDELKRTGLDFDALLDRWGKPYKLELNVTGTYWHATVRSGGANGKFETPIISRSDDFIVWTGQINYFESVRTLLDQALARHFAATGLFPENDAELRSAIKSEGVEFDRLHDAWGNGYYAVFSRRFGYGDRIVISYQELQGGKADLKPVTQQFSLITLRSQGADGRQDTNDDFTLAEFARLVAEQSSFDQKPQPVAGNTPLLSAMGAIKGVATDLNNAVISGSVAKDTNKLTHQHYEARSNNEGEFLLRNLPGGRYDLECWAPGFRSVIVTDVIVASSTITQVNLVLQVGSTTETVTISASVEQVQTESSLSSSKIVNLPLNSRNAMNLMALKPGVQVAMRSELSTPRLREHFQETLVWQPQLETDKQGRAQIKFNLADNITTWKLAVVGSTVDGQIGFAEKEFLAFQPFFAEHEPPRVLTVGDEIALPVVLRNYLNKSQTVTTEMKSENWFTLLGSARQKTTVAAADAAKAIFDFRATASVSEGTQRVTAIGSDASDAIEKTVSVHPDGQELAQTASSIFSNQGALNLFVPEDAIKGSLRAELKIYPNLMTHALEGIEGILHRPYGCGEQTISSTYPNLMVLRYLKQQGESVAAIAAKAQRYAQAGYERLLGYRTAGGGFSYWGRDEADLALTAYAVRFLNDAREFVEVDGSVIAKARDWVIGQQQADGSWRPRYSYGRDDVRQVAITTAYVARVLAAESRGMQKPDKKLRETLRLALKFLAARSSEIDEPYLIASYALAASDASSNIAGDVSERDGVAKAIGRLRQLAHDETGTASWQLESNTPFYGWGLAGRIETTALVLQALLRETQTTRQGDGARDELIDRGLLFLLRNKDRYGVWLSTQATITVLDTLIRLSEAEKGKADAGSQAEIFINGHRFNTAVLPPGNRVVNPILVDLSSAFGSGQNRIEIRRAGDVTLATAQIVETHYAPWKIGQAEGRENIKSGTSSAMRLAVNYDKSTAKIGEEVTCNVVAERIGYRGYGGYGGYGMMLAEIGLPPGADVDRASLEAAVKDSRWELNHYDVLPDRVIVYLWPQAGGTKFSFKFKLRYGIRAQSARSVLYDYYNPEAQTVVAPIRFIVN